MSSSFYRRVTNFVLFLVNRSATADIRLRARDVDATFVLTAPARAPRVLEATADVASVREVFVIGQHEGCTPVDRILQEPVQGIVLLCRGSFSHTSCSFLTQNFPI